VLLFIILLLTLFISFNNLRNYNTWWADDGGAHIAYTKTILEKQRLPTFEETYLSWHEPLYYLILAGWSKIGEFFQNDSLNWWESLNVFFYFIFLFLVWLLAYDYSQKNKWLALLNVFLFSIFFVGIKLSVYVNNEILVHVLIILLVILFCRWQLLAKNKQKLVIWWSIILGLATLVKLTAFIILLVAIIIWLFNFVANKKRYFLLYIFFVIFIVGAINIPWFIYKQNKFGEAFSINLYERQNKQNILKSDGWQYLRKINYKIFFDYPYWYSQPQSFFSILLGDSFGDYYNLFNNVDKINSIPVEQKILVNNGRYTTANLWQSMLLINRVGFFITLIWFVGFFGEALLVIRNKEIDYYKFFLMILFFAGLAALIYNNLRFPYLERGVAKAAFIYFTFPLLTAISYSWWWQRFKNKIIAVIFILIPLLIYLGVAWPILLVS
jgi:4-amino-4-deoxy-L-arabinose transferase-like glycosyltransferase